MSERATRASKKRQNVPTSNMNQVLQQSLSHSVGSDSTPNGPVCHAQRMTNEESAKSELLFELGEEQGCGGEGGRVRGD